MGCHYMRADILTGQFGRSFLVDSAYKQHILIIDIVTTTSLQQYPIRSKKKTKIFIEILMIRTVLPLVNFEIKHDFSEN